MQIYYGWYSREVERLWGRAPQKYYSVTTGKEMYITFASDNFPSDNGYHCRDREFVGLVTAEPCRVISESVFESTQQELVKLEDENEKLQAQVDSREMTLMAAYERTKKGLPSYIYPGPSHETLGDESPYCPINCDDCAEEDEDDYYDDDDYYYDDYYDDDDYYYEDEYYDDDSIIIIFP